MPDVVVKRSLQDHLRVLETNYLEDALRSARSQVQEIAKQVRERRQSVRELEKREVAAITTDLLTKAALAQISSWGWLAYPEVSTFRLGCVARRRIDIYAVRPAESGLATAAFEIKTSLADFTHELRNPDKRRPAQSVSHEFWFIAPAGLIPVHRVPVDTGLLEYRPAQNDMVVAKHCPPLV
jgi:hypothetical protein